MRYYILPLFLLFSILINAQTDPETGTPVQGVTVLQRSNFIQDEPIVTGAGEFGVVPTSTKPTGTSTEVGITEGQLSVSLSGAANYSIPIAVPPGINGVVPQISLGYSSQGGNGLAGYGWNVSGISSITRIPSTTFHDGVIDPVDFDELDRFALDGQRLVIKSGTTIGYGKTGAQYETENFSNLKIISIGVHPLGAKYGPQYFEVFYPDGSYARYGSTENSRSIMEYSITFWQNPQRVQINYNYTLNANNLSINSITYGTVASVTTVLNKIQFNYVSRQRPEQSYVGGESVTFGHLLKSIVITGRGVGFRSYTLTHDTTTLGYQRLTGITESSGDGTKSYNPTVFSYDTTASEIKLSNSFRTSFEYIKNLSTKNVESVTGDFDGDGKMDFLLYNKSPGPKNNFASNTAFINTGRKNPIQRFWNIYFELSRNFRFKLD